MTMKDSDAVAIATVRAMCRDGRARTIRATAALSLAELGQIIDVSHTAVSRWELGQRAPRGEAALRYYRLLRRLADATTVARAS